MAKAKRKYDWDDMIGSAPEENSEAKKGKSERKNKSKSVPVSFSIREDLLERINRFCYWNHASRSELAEKLIEKFLNNYEEQNSKLRKIPKKGLDDLI